MRAFGKSLVLLALVAVLVIVLNVSSEESEALDRVERTVNFNPEEVTVFINSEEVEPLASIRTADLIWVEEKTGYCNPKVNGSNYNQNGVLVTASLRNSGIVITTEKKHYSLSFNTENTQGTVPIPLNNITIGTEITLPSPSFFRYGYQMTGWNTGNNSSGVSYSAGMITVNASFLDSVFAESENSILYPEWVPIEYSFIFNNNGGSGVVPG